jgi:hypothetical protein
VRGLARLARHVARGLAAVGQAAAVAVELLALGFERGHAPHRLLQPGARLAHLLLRLVARLSERGELGVDAGDARLRRFQPALLALQLAGELGHAAVAQVQRALRVLAVLLGLEQAVAAMPFNGSG